MKKIFVKYPASNAEVIADFIGANSLVSLVSWATKDGGMFDTGHTIYQWIAYPESMSDKIAANLQKYYVTPA